ncbi:MAG TPA: DNA starvation/stationary phase protection protein [Tissierellaceae bacterium]|nr:DNA starvation/stationary phase protection protein [Tissierellaceae bacterium]
MKNVDLVQKYLSNLAILNVKLHNIHWNVVGKKFIRVHDYTEELYDELFEAFDEVAELLKMKDILPLSTMAEYLENGSIEEVKAKDFTVEESLELVKKDLETMKELATEIRNTADEANDFETVAMFEDYVAFYSKHIWFLNAMLK